MNKTININLAGMFFHIDEDAYAKLQHYLEAIKRAFTDAEGRQEIIQDIEARIAELFSERIKHERQVISLAEVEQVIEIMGQPEDYVLDDEFFDEEPQATPYTSTHTKKLYRDTENSYIGGVSAGFGHYFGIDAIWIRLVLALLTIFSSGGFILLYIGFWIFVPAANTTAEKLEMRGKPVNIDNIQRKVREGFENVADSVKNANYSKFTQSLKKGSSGLADSLSKLVLLLLTVLVKLIGILLIIIGGTTVIGLFIGFFTAGTLGLAYGGLGDFFGMLNATSVPVWLISLLTFLALAIPFFSLFYLGLKILVNNLKRMPWAVKILLIITWFASVIALSVISVRQALDFSEEGKITQTEPLAFSPADTLQIQFQQAEARLSYPKMMEDLSRSTYRNINFRIAKSADSTYALQLTKTARGLNNTEAKKRAAIITYQYTLENGILNLAPGFNIPPEAKLRDQRLEATLYIPSNSSIYLDERSKEFIQSSNNYILNASLVGHYLEWSNEKLVCTDCNEPQTEFDEEENDDRYDYEEQQENDAAVYQYDEALQKRQQVTKPSNKKDTLIQKTENND